MEFYHKPVLFEECIEYLNINPDGVYVDATIGGGGHSSGILEALSEKGRLIGLDQDENAIEASEKRLSRIGKNVTLVRENFVNIEAVLRDLQIPEVDGILMDLGVSSHQLDEAERGFSYQKDAPLDMRMDRRRSLTAATVVNSYSRQDLERIIREYGEEKWASRIADFIVREREISPIETTGRLADIIKSAIPASARREGPHPAKRTFQAIRIEVNGELDVLGKAIRSAVNVLRPGGRLCIITFHSLEDRIVKNEFSDMENPCTCPPDFPVCICGKKPVIRVITKKPITGRKEEIVENPRARSAKLRVAQKLGSN